MKRCSVHAIQAAVIGLAIGAMASCGGYDPDATTTLYLPDYDAFRDYVHPYLNKQCGTLDCHGQVGRPLRIYGKRGLRLFDKNAGLVPGGDETVPEEYRATYESVLGLEPEATRRVVACDQDPETLLFLRKPKGLGPNQSDSNGTATGERHKGGTVITPASAEAVCLRGWLAASCNPGGFEAVRRECEDALKRP